MFKQLFCLVVICLISISLYGCSKNKAIILLNDYPISKENLLKNSIEFKTGYRIYYIFITEKQLTIKFIRIRIMKRDEKAGYSRTKLVYADDFRLSQDQMYYYNNYVVINEAGYYTLFVYSKDDLRHPLAMADFEVKTP